MRDSLHKLGGLTIATLILGGCAANPFGSSTPSPQTLLDQAQHQTGQEAAQNRLQAADILTQQGNSSQAVSVLRQINARRLNDSDKARYATLLAQGALKTGDAKAALTTTNILNTHIPLSDTQKQTLETVRGEAQGKLGNHLQSAITLIQAQRDANNTTDLNNDIWGQLSQLNASQLNRVPDPDSLADGWITLAQLHLQAGNNIDSYKTQISNWQTAYPDHPASQELPESLTSIQNTQTQTINKIAILLPQSGDLSTVSQAIKQGIQAQQQALTQSGQSAPSIDFIDASQGNLQSLYQQAEQAGAQVVIGPLDKNLVTQLEQQTSAPLPTLALNYGNSATNNNPDLYEYGLSAEDEARQAAIQASADGHHKANILVPNNDWGNRVYNSFAQQWQTQGGQVADVEHYNPNGAVTNTVTHMLHNGGNAADMIFMLALPPYARQVPPTLAFYNTHLPIYATSHVYTGTPNTDSDSDLNGIKFPNIPWEIPQVVGSSNLPDSAAYQQLSQAQLPPPVFKLAAMGVDAYNLARNLSIYKAIPSTKINGATGLLQIDNNRRFERQLPWAEFKGGVPAQP